MFLKDKYFAPGAFEKFNVRLVVVATVDKGGAYLNASMEESGAGDRAHAARQDHDRDPNED